MKKRVFAAAAVLALALSGAAMAADVYVGSCIYKFDDTFMTGVRNAMKAEMDALRSGKKTREQVADVAVALAKEAQAPAEKMEVV